MKKKIIGIGIMLTLMLTLVPVEAGETAEQNIDPTGGTLSPIEKLQYLEIFFPGYLDFTEIVKECRQVTGSFDEKLSIIVEEGIPGVTITIFCKVDIQSEEGTGSFSWLGPVLIWRANGPISITGYGTDYVTNEPSGGLLFLFTGTATEEPFNIVGNALIAYSCRV